MFTPISGASWQTSCLHQEFSFHTNPPESSPTHPKPITSCSFIPRLIIPEPSRYKDSLSATQRYSERRRRRPSEGERVRWDWRRRRRRKRKWSDSIREARTRAGVTEAVWVGHRRQICKLAVNGFSILELNYAICLLGLVLPLFEGFKLQMLCGLWWVFSTDNTAHKKGFYTTFQTPKWKLRADSLLDTKLFVATLQRKSRSWFWYKALKQKPDKPVVALLISLLLNWKISTKALHYVWIKIRWWRWNVSRKMGEATPVSKSAWKVKKSAVLKYSDRERGRTWQTWTCFKSKCFHSKPFIISAFSHVNTTQKAHNNIKFIK